MEAKTDLRQYIAILWHWAALLVLAAALAGTLAYVFSSRQQPTYQASTTVLIDEAPGNKGSADYQSVLTSERRARTYTQLLTTGPLLDAVIAKLELRISAGDLKDEVSVQSVRDTQLIRVAVTDENPQQAARIANTLVQLFAAQTEELQTSRYGASKENLQAQMGVLEEQIRQAETELAALKSGASEKVTRDRLETTLAQYRQSYANVLQSYEQVRLAEAGTASGVVQVEPATVPTSPVSPRVLFSTALAAVVGLLVAVGLVFLKEALDDSVKGPEELSEQTGLPVLGMIARVRKGGTKPIVVAEPRSPIAEAFRSLRTNLQFTSVDRPLRTLLITSPTPSEGKSTLAVNLSAVLAQSGRSVMLVDADMRRPMLHKRLEVSNRSGLSDLFVQQHIDLTTAVRSTGIKGVSVVASGAIPPNPAELVGSAKMGDILEHLQMHSDIVVIDSPPVTPVTDAVVLSQHVDGVLLVVRAGETSLGACKQAVEQLRHVGANVIGIVVNDIQLGRSRYSYAYRGYYRYYHYQSSDQDGDNEGGRRWFRRKARKKVDAHS